MLHVVTSLREDVEFYCSLRYPGDGRLLRRALACVSSVGLLVLAVQRLDHYYDNQRRRVGWTLETIALKLPLLIGKALALTVGKSDVAAASDFASGVYLSDGGHLIIGPERVGRGTIIHDRVTIGVRAGGTIKPVIGENVWIGPNCVIYGEITIGDGASILPGSVLSMSVPARALVGGNPAVIVQRDFDNARLRQSLATRVDYSLSAAA
jgi:serine acetyltransferase